MYGGVSTHIRHSSGHFRGNVAKEGAMKGKAALLIGAGAGYLLGTRAGRQRYEQIKSTTERLWRDPKVQQTSASAAQSVSNVQAGRGVDG